MTKLRSTFLSVGLTLVASVAFLTPAQASERQSVEASVERVAEVATQSSVIAPAAKLSFEAPSIKSVAAPVAVEVPVAVAPQATTTQVTPKTSSNQVQTKAAPKAASVQAAPAQAAVIAAPASGRGAALLAAAQGQIGQIQDCTAMVERALGSLGIVTGDLAPAQFFKFGTVVGSPAPGDIIISAGHVGIYAGNGQMVSGGFNGNQTVQHPISYVGGFTAVRI